MAKFSPKIEIINHFDNLINKVDIDIDTCLENYKGDKILRQLPLINTDRPDYYDRYNILQVRFYSSSNHHQSLVKWPKTTKVVDYLKQIRMTTIEELRKAQEDTLEYYKLNSSRFKSELNDEKNIDELRSELFAEKFYFQVNFTQSKQRLWAFNIFTFATDFYVSPTNIDLLEKLINHEEKPFCRDAVFDEETILIFLLYKCFFNNLLTFHNHIIPVSKQDVSNIESINVTNDFSRVNLTGSSIDMSKIVALHLIDRCLDDRTDSIEINIEGLSSLKRLHLGINMDKVKFSTSFWSACPSQTIQQLNLYGNFPYFNLNNFINLNSIFLDGTITENFNFELFKNLCNQLESLVIKTTDIDSKTSLFKMFDGYRFPYLQCLAFSRCFIERVDKNFINRFPMLIYLYMHSCNLETIEDEAFSNLKELFYLGLSGNRISFIGKNAFSNLKYLEVIELCNNGLKHIDREFVGLENTVEIQLDDVTTSLF